MMKKILVVGGSNGIGLSIVSILKEEQECEKIYVVDKCPIGNEYCNEKIEFINFNLLEEDYSLFSSFQDIDCLIITAGFGKLSLFKDLSEEYIVDSFCVNSIAPIRIIHYFMPLLLDKKDFYCGIMGSISGFMSSPFFSVYGATKAALRIFIESINVELIKAGTTNRILNISPGFIEGTSFYKDKTDLTLTSSLAKDIIENIRKKNDLFIPHYNDVYRAVLERYHKDFRAEGIHSYEYKASKNIRKSF